MIDRVASFAEREGSLAPDVLKDFVDTIVLVAPYEGLDPAMLIARSAYATRGWVSNRWVEHTDPCNLGLHVTSGKEAAYAMIRYEKAVLGRYEDIYGGSAE